MKRADIYDLNPSRKEVIDLRSDVKREDLPENACCIFLKALTGRLNIPQLGMYQMEVNYCFVCGKKLR
ncbi:MAG: hypothetical protein M0Z52_03900 [Actinomycetota bacterium]|nr:hypothetical protein [Actinomycetota bacterium]